MLSPAKFAAINICGNQIEEIYKLECLFDLVIKGKLANGHENSPAGCHCAAVEEFPDTFFLHNGINWI